MNKHKTRTQIRKLLSGEQIPPGEPARYKNAAGYVRLRWKVGVCQYVEVYEHRLIAGLDSPEVHHCNLKTDDNRPENLIPLTSIEHGEKHSRIDGAEAARLYAEGWSLPRLARRYGVGDVTVLRFFKRRGFKLRSLVDAWKYRQRIA